MIAFLASEQLKVMFTTLCRVSKFKIMLNCLLIDQILDVMNGFNATIFAYG